MSFTPSEKDIENYNQLKVELLRQLRKGLETFPLSLFFSQYLI